MDKAIIFDSDCPFCNKTILHLAKLDKYNGFYFIANTSVDGINLIKRFGLQHIMDESIILVLGDRYFLRSAAVIKFFEVVNKYPSLRLLHRLVPLKISDLVYNLISKNRKKINVSSCAIPKKEITSKFILT